MVKESKPGEGGSKDKLRKVRGSEVARTEAITFRVSKEEKTVFEAFAGMKGESVTQFLRTAAVDRVVGLVDKAGGVKPFFEEFDAAEHRRVAEAQRRVKAIESFITGALGENQSSEHAD